MQGSLACSSAADSAHLSEGLDDLTHVRPLQAHVAAAPSVWLQGAGVALGAAARRARTAYELLLLA